MYGPLDFRRSKESTAERQRLRRSTRRSRVFFVLLIHRLATCLVRMRLAPLLHVRPGLLTHFLALVLVAFAPFAAAFDAGLQALALVCIGAAPLVELGGLIGAFLGVLFAVALAVLVAGARAGGRGGCARGEGEGGSGQEGRYQ